MDWRGTRLGFYEKQLFTSRRTQVVLEKKEILIFLGARLDHAYIFTVYVQHASSSNQ